MIQVLPGPLVVEPTSWMLVFDREASSRWLSLIAFGRYKHVRAFAYVPFLHVWVFFDPHIGGTDIVVAADGEPAQALMQRWLVNADVLRMPRRPGWNRPALFGFCVPVIKRLIGLRSGALRPSALYRHCLRNGGEPFEAADGRTDLQAAPA